jgi:hypothetical protein
MTSRLYITALAISVAVGCTACTTIPTDALALPPDSMAHRQLQSRKFEGTSEKALLAASAGVLQDLGFNLDESETRLGLVVASKERSAYSASQITMAIIAAAFGVAESVDKRQKIRVSLVVRPADGNANPTDARDFVVRVTIQRIIWNTSGQITHTLAVDEPEIYQQFFDKLGKSLFLTANEI